MMNRALLNMITLASVAACLVVLAGCPSKSAGVCDSEFAPDSCGQPCTLPTDCSDGTYCGASTGECTADCTPGSNECGEGATCAPDGSCQPGSCASIALNVTSIVPSIELVIDRSGSMKWDFSGNNQNPPAGQSRWDAIKTALIAPTTGLINVLQNGVYFGAQLYYYQANASECHSGLTATRSIANGDAITALINGTAPNGGTPTALAVDQAVAQFSSNPPPTDSPKYILLVTDGEPTLPCQGNTYETNGSLTVASVQAAHAAGITTLVLGVSNQVAAANLQRFANAGQGLPPDGATKADYAVSSSTADLVDDLTALLGSTRSCDLTLQGSVDPAAASAGTVQLNGTTLTHGTDWTVLDAQTLQLVGAACETFLSTPTATLSADFPCDAVVAIS
ncbi:MAG: VWA domain-containing protein [Myxococcales bacterium]|nr:VWA domain-containing protein [Myxococcales bacterium]